MINLQVPIDEKMVRSLRVGDQVSLSGGVITARDPSLRSSLRLRGPKRMNARTYSESSSD